MSRKTGEGAPSVSRDKLSLQKLKIVNTKEYWMLKTLMIYWKQENAQVLLTVSKINQVNTHVISCQMIEIVCIGNDLEISWIHIYIN